MAAQVGVLGEETTSLGLRDGLEEAYASEILGTRREHGTAAPQVFYVGQPTSGSRVPPHFHGVDQFQLTVHGDGMLGRTPIRPFSFHYADAWQPYGPIVAGPDGLSYMSVRARHDDGAQLMPEGQTLRKGRPRRQHFIEPVDLNDIDGSSVIVEHSDGLRVTTHRVARSQTLELDAADCSDGLIAVVLEGVLAVDGSRLPELGCLAIRPGKRISVESGHDGSKLIAFQFPEPLSTPAGA